MGSDVGYIERSPGEQKIVDEIVNGSYEKSLLSILEDQETELVGILTEFVNDDSVSYQKALFLFTMCYFFGYTVSSVVNDLICMGALRSVADIGLNVVNSCSGKINNDGICALLSSQLEIGAFCSFNSRNMNYLQSVINQ